MPILNSRTEGRTDDDPVPAPEGLARLGPIIPVTLTLSDEALKAYAARGEFPPPTVNGFAMIDTGASTTCFDARAAQEAGLPTVGTAKMSSASHANHAVPTFAGRLICPTIHVDVEAGMGANLSEIGGDGPGRLIALLGRDALASAILIYNGPDGSFSLAT